MAKRKFPWEWLETLLAVSGLPLTMVAAGSYGRLPGLVVSINTSRNTLQIFTEEAIICEFPNLSQSHRNLFAEGGQAVKDAYLPDGSLKPQKRKQAKVAFKGLMHEKEVSNSVCVANNLAVLFILQCRYSKAKHLLHPHINRSRYGSITDPALVRIVKNTVYHNYEIAVSLAS